MTMTQRYAGMLRRHAGDWDKRDLPVQSECCRQAARHMEELQAKVDAVQSPWQPMKTAPKDGWGVLVLLDGSDMPHGARWLRGKDDPHSVAIDEAADAIERMQNWLEGDCYCPCCTGVRECAEDCTLAADDPNAAERMAGAREALFGA